MNVFLSIDREGARPGVHEATNPRTGGATP